MVDLAVGEDVARSGSVMTMVMMMMMKMMMMMMMMMMIEPLTQGLVSSLRDIPLRCSGLHSLSHSLSRHADQKTYGGSAIAVPHEYH